MDTEKNGRIARRPTVGVMTGSFHTDYSKQITEAICSLLKSEGMDVLLFQGLDASRYLNIDGYVDKGFDSHYYSQFEYAKFIRPDLLIVSFGTISAVSDPMSMEDFFAILPEVPTIVLEVKADIPHGMYILPDNYGGMCRCVEHLITEHGCRNIYYISGPERIADAALRLNAYRDTMKKHGLDDRNKVFYGNYTDQVDDLIERALSDCPRPDAIVCANDEMAESAYRVLKAHGLRPGTDVAVTGFDDNAAAKLMDPPLTTVQQSKDEIAQKILEVLRAFLAGERSGSVTLPARLKIRESCGCRPAPEDEDSAQAYSSGAHIQAMKDRRTIKRLSHESMLTSLLLRNLLEQNISVHSFFRRLGEVLHQLGVAFSMIALLDEPMTVSSGSAIRLPDKLRLHMVQNGGEVRSRSRRDAEVITPADAPTLRLKALDQAPDQYDAVFPLFYGNRHYGVLVVRLPLDDMLFFYTISLQIGTGLRYLYMALDDQEARAALEEKNQILDFSASHDNLTGLYNRVGVVNHIYEYIHAGGSDARFVAVMADLDHLKQINDTFGHSMGDLAICRAAEILKGALPPDAPLGRSGGDEFMAVFACDGEDAPERFCSRLKEACKAHNDLLEMPVYVEITAGCHAFKAAKSVDVPAMFRAADRQLYAEKPKRRASVIREKNDGD